MLPRMRTIQQAVAELKKEDENTAVTEHYLRKLVKCGHIPSVNTGHKILINIDTIGKYLEKQPTTNNILPMYSGIRRVGT